VISNPFDFPRGSHIPLEESGDEPLTIVKEALANDAQTTEADDLRADRRPDDLSDNGG
jgi:hypothetical protein